MIDAACRWSAAFEAAGLARGARVVVALPHGVPLYASYLGALLGDYVPAMFAFPSPKLSLDEYLRTFEALLDATQPAAFVTYPELAARAAELLSAREITVLTPGAEESHRPLVPPCAARPGDVAFVQYSSGTTGVKKGVEISHAALLSQIDRYAEAIALRSDDVVVSWLPLYHDMGLIACFFLPLLKGIPVVAMSPFDWVLRPTWLLEAIAEFRGTLCWLPNFAFALLARTTSPARAAGLDLRSMRGFVNCSEPILHESQQAFCAALAAAGMSEDMLAGSYAMAENTFAVTSSGFGTPPAVISADRERLASSGHVAPPDNPTRARWLVSSGGPLPDTTVQIVDAAGHLLPDGEVGEVVVASPSLAAGYLDRADAFSGGRFSTGDVGFLRDGHLFVTGRSKDILIVAGRNVFPQDLEEAAAAVPGTIAGRVCAFGVPDVALGTERAVLLAESDVPDAASLAESITRKVAEATGTVPDDVRVVPPRTLRKSTSGKLARAANRDWYLSRFQAPAAMTDTATASAPSLVSTWSGSAEDVLVVIRSLVAQRAGTERAAALDVESPLVTSGLIDSLTLVSLVLALERASGVAIPPYLLDVGHFNTAAKVARLLAHASLAHASPEALQAQNQVAPVDDRQKAALLFREHSRQLDTLILGSSRARHLSPRVARIRGLAAFNFWTLSARAEDYYAATRFALDELDAEGRTLRAVLLGVDVEAFTPALGSDMRLLESPLVAKYLDHGETAARGDVGADRFGNLLWELRMGRDEPEILRDASGQRTERLLLSDAPGEAPQPLRLTDPQGRHEVYTLRMRGFDGFAPWRVDYFRRLVGLLRERGIPLVCAVTPMHRGLDQFLSETTAYAARLQDLFTLLEGVVAPGVRWIDAHAVDAFGGDPDDFENAAHMGRWNAERLTAAMLDLL